MPDSWMVSLADQWSGTGRHSVCSDHARVRRVLTDRGDYVAATDQELMSWSAEGDRRAFDQVVARHGTLVLRTARRLASDVAAAEDLAQECLVRAWNKAAQFDHARSSLGTWLYQIVTNLAIDQSRRRRPEALPENYDAPDPAPSPELRMDEAARHRALAGAVRELPVRHRAVMGLVYREGLSGAEAARMLGMSAKGVERLLARARAMVRTRLLPPIECEDTET
ncbi:sigma-70 family RNA polymerase sigma factor [Acetobacteraceae bacterium KSS8]|uniref:Sigma-70 family RNA polymerase sigma factor n=1 Tax=Endosaccharibacter trunci TaxID=2812733 RepID=A0ABT1W3W7_9PROT|nr:sigma-70 family RNA polymerase sigma factor [Acetobacteraceae bacterium KSS8]